MVNVTCECEQREWMQHNGSVAYAVLSLQEAAGRLVQCILFYSALFSSGHRHSRIKIHAIQLSLQPIHEEWTSGEQRILRKDGNNSVFI